LKSFSKEKSGVSNEEFEKSFKGKKRSFKRINEDKE